MAYEIQKGDMYIRPEAPTAVWFIRKFVDLPGLPRHAEMVSAESRVRTMLTSEVALVDPRLWRSYEADLRDELMDALRGDSEADRKPGRAAA